jgi:hypothetical protein
MRVKMVYRQTNMRKAGVEEAVGYWRPYDPNTWIQAAF